MIKTLISLVREHFHFSHMLQSPAEMPSFRDCLLYFLNQIIHCLSLGTMALCICLSVTLILSISWTCLPPRVDLTIPWNCVFFTCVSPVLNPVPVFSGHSGNHEVVKNCYPYMSSSIICLIKSPFRDNISVFIPPLTRCWHTASGEGLRERCKKPQIHGSTG